MSLHIAELELQITMYHKSEKDFMEKKNLLSKLLVYFEL